MSKQIRRRSASKPFTAPVVQYSRTKDVVAYWLAESWLRADPDVARVDWERYCWGYREDCSGNDFVYFARLPDGNIKVGISANPYARMGELDHRGVADLLLVIPGVRRHFESAFKWLLRDFACRGTEVYPPRPIILRLVDMLRACTVQEAA